MLTDLLSSVHEQNQLEICTLSGIEVYQYTQKGAAFTKATVTQGGRVAKIKVYQGNGPQLTQNLIGQSLTFNLRSYQAQNNNIYISGFWNDKVPPSNNLPAQQAPQQSYQPPQQPPQATNPEQGGSIVQIAERIAVALEKIADKGQSFEEIYNIPKESDCPI